MKETSSGASKNFQCKTDLRSCKGSDIGWNAPCKPATKTSDWATIKSGVGAASTLGRQGLPFPEIDLELARAWLMNY